VALYFISPGDSCALASRTNEELNTDRIILHCGKKNSFLGAIDLKGTPFQSASIATGFGSHLAQPILRKELESRGGEDNITQEQAVEILKKCMKVLWYRDARSMNKVLIYAQSCFYFLHPFLNHPKTTF